MKTSFERLIRFRDPAGRVLYGEGPVSDAYIGKRTRLHSGNLPWDLQSTDETAEIAEVQEIPLTMKEKNRADDSISRCSVLCRRLR